jgi:hypothetical protein
MFDRTFLVAPKFAQFVFENGRVPMLDSGEKPWTIPGWLLWTTVLASFYDGVVNRWDYWYRTKNKNGKLAKGVVRRAVERESDFATRAAACAALDLAAAAEQRPVEEKRGIAYLYRMRR